MKLRVSQRKLKTASQFSFAQWKTLGRAYYHLLRTRLLLRFFPLFFIKKACIQTPLSQISSRDPKAKELIGLFHIAWRYQWRRPKCLVTSLAKRSFLLDYGLASPFHIGIKKESEKLQAHAWCEEKNHEFQALEPLQ